MRRRDFIALLSGVAGNWPLAVRAQPGGPMRLIGVLMGFPESDTRARSWLAAFRGALAKLGWMEGSNLRFELRWSAADVDRMRTFAKELVDLRPDAIFSQTTPAIGALARETQTIPIVFVLVSDPIGSGFAASLAHPSGNITGFTGNDPAIGGKWMELLKAFLTGRDRLEGRVQIAQQGGGAADRGKLTLLVEEHAHAPGRPAGPPHNNGDSANTA
jgi:putative tryptophan/tyrosine transport system substrate-binding protein